jgi:hypothetical protein
MKTTFPLSREGYITTYMTTLPRVEDFEAPLALKDQLEFEKQMRDIFYKEPECPMIQQCSAKRRS